MARQPSQCFPRRDQRVKPTRGQPSPILGTPKKLIGSDRPSVVQDPAAVLAQAEIGIPGVIHSPAVADCGRALDDCHVVQIMLGGAYHDDRPLLGVVTVHEHERVNQKDIPNCGQHTGKVTAHLAAALELALRQRQGGSLDGLNTRLSLFARASRCEGFGRCLCCMLAFAHILQNFGEASSDPNTLEHPPEHFGSFNAGFR